MKGVRHQKANCHLDRRKRGLFISLLAPKKQTKEKAPSSLAFGSPSETLYRGGGKNSLRSAALQRVSKPLKTKTVGGMSIRTVRQAVQECLDARNAKS
jgi:hypothetical protein